MNNKVKRHPSPGQVINMEIGEGYSGGSLQTYPPTPQPRWECPWWHRPNKWVDDLWGVGAPLKAVKGGCKVSIMPRKGQIWDNLSPLEWKPIRLTGLDESPKKSLGDSGTERERDGEDRQMNRQAFCTGVWQLFELEWQVKRVLPFPQRSGWNPFHCKCCTQNVRPKSLWRMPCLRWDCLRDRMLFFSAAFLFFSLPTTAFSNLAKLLQRQFHAP